MAEAAAGGAGLLDTIVKLVNIGFAGVGVAVLLFVFVILMQGKPADAGTQRLRHRFLTWGMGFAFFCGVLSVAAPLLAPRPVVASDADMLLSFSPRFETQGLSAPAITLPDGRTVGPGTRFVAQDGQVLVSVDEALQDVAALRETALALAENANAAQQQADSAVAALAQADGTPTPPPAVQEAAEQASQASQQAASALSQAIRAGDYRVLERQNRTLSQATRDSIAARSRVIRGQ